MSLHFLIFVYTIDAGRRAIPKNHASSRPHLARTQKDNHKEPIDTGRGLNCPLSLKIIQFTFNTVGKTLMRSTITERGQTVIPAAIRRELGLSPSDRLEWVLTSDGLRVIPVKADPVEAFRGRGAGGSVERLLADREADRSRE